MKYLIYSVQKKHVNFSNLPYTPKGLLSQSPWC